MRVKILIFSCFVVLCFFDQGHGFASNSSTRQKRSQCGENLVSDYGTIESPNYPSNYPAFLNCIWRITSPTSSRIRLSFISFSLEAGSTCRSDALEVHDGPSLRSDLLATLCGNAIPDPIESTGNALFLRFRTDVSGAYRGFKVEFMKVLKCGADLTSDQGDISSPNYPQNYGENEQCAWTIRVPVSFQVKLRFRSFQLEDSYDCEVDFLEIYDGPSNRYKLLGRFCGMENPKNMDTLSSSNSMTLVFKSDSSGNFRGFSAQYSKVKASSLSTGNVAVSSVVATIVRFVFLAFISVHHYVI